MHQCCNQSSASSSNGNSMTKGMMNGGEYCMDNIQNVIFSINNKSNNLIYIKIYNKGTNANADRWK